MARIRTVKPELFKHEGLYDLERETGLPIRLAWIGLFTMADREGRFRWRPRMLKAELFPYDDDLDFSRVLDALASRGFLVKYAFATADSGQGTGEPQEIYGCIPSFGLHQVINNKESPSRLPAPDPGCIKIKPELVLTPKSTREPRVTDACSTPLNLTQGEGKGREGNKEGKTKAAQPLAAEPATLPVVLDGNQEKPRPQSVAVVIATYCKVWQARYGSRPGVMGKDQGICRRLAQSFGVERAAELITVYLKMQDQWFIKKRHDLSTLEGNINSVIHYQQTGMLLTTADARQAEQRSVFDDLIDRLPQEGNVHE